MSEERINPNHQPAEASPLSPLDQADFSREPGVREYPEETLCPSCGRFVGAYEKCPYCGAELKKRMSLILWKRIAVFGTLLGLAVMWFAASAMNPPEIQLGEISETYNNAIVTVEGVVTGRRIYEDRGMLMLTIADKSGSIGAMSYRGLEDFRRLGNLPKVGDRIRTVGSISMDATYGVSMGLNLPHRLVILEGQKPQEAEIGRIKDSWVGSLVTVKGGIKQPPRFGKAVVSDGAAEILVALDEANLGEGLPEFKEGQGVRITGVVVKDKNKLVLIPGSLEDIESVEAYSLEVPTLKIREIDLTMLEKIVEIEGKAAGFRAFKNGGGALTVSDGTGTIGVPVFGSNYDQISGAERLKINGTPVRIRGKVGEYQNKPQIQPLSAEGIKILN